MQVRVTEEGHLVIPPAIREELGIRPGTLLDVAANRGILQASVITSSPKNQTATIAEIKRIAAWQPLNHTRIRYRVPMKIWIR